ncbi:magnesium transporter MgtE N-terminal domain-containing protein [Citrobacter koseri]|uniref:magnesium transporter MgtE N-terminal domain-containing protein n=1 Tax=Gammaproteobacteria TaxID=1236 RepID=UPI000483C3B9|nr:MULTISPECIES: CBS domain-containing protein [Gammaproteobacteria]EKV5614140.1 magnesium transporter [Citrobacter koseri]QSD89662.1 magnesium transporter [Serratia marcescens]ELP5236360.1 magnesium transporter [Citrobacter freundii]MCD2461124.1 CBS domain-containing protein [Enterobacter cloacae complex sp. 2021EL-01261]MCG3895425.1 magnesium transporter [Escherichia coli]
MVALINKNFFLTDIIGRKVFMSEQRIGKLSDFIIVENGPIPEISLLVISRPFGEPQLLVPWEKVVMITANEIVIDIENLAPYTKKTADSQILLKDFILDKKVLDLDDNEVEVVFDVKLSALDGKLYASEVDLSHTRILRRLGMRRLADFFAKSHPDTLLSWSYIQPLPEHIGSFKGNVKLKVFKENLADIHPVDLADILEELDHSQRVVVFEQLESEHASDTLEEVEPRVQREIISSIKIEKAVDLIRQMTAAQAADIINILPADEAQEILSRLNPELAAKICALTKQHEETASLFMLSGFVTFPPTATAKEVLDQYRDVARDKDVVMYIYVVDENRRLAGVLDIREVLQSDPTTQLSEAMNTHVISFNPEDSLHEVAKAFERYSFRAIPVTDADKKILGVIPYRDVMNLKHNFV